MPENREPRASMCRSRISKSSARVTGTCSSAARAKSTANASGRCRAKTAGIPGFRIPAFSLAMASMVWPRYASWSKSMGVITVRTGSTTLVESRRPPRPTSITAVCDALFPKQPEGHGGDGFEIGRVAVQVELFGGFVHDIERALEIRGAHRNAVDLDALGRLDQMRRSEQAGANARGAQSRLDHGAGRAFAVGPGDVHHAKRALGIPQRLEHGADPLQAQLGGLDFVAQSVEELDGIGIGHAVTCLPARRYTSHAVPIISAVPASELSFEQPEAADLARGHGARNDGQQGHGDARNGGQVPAGLPRAGEQVEIRNESGQDHEREQRLIRGAQGIAQLDREQQHRRHSAEHQDREIRRRPLRMQARESRWQEMIDARRIRHPRYGRAQAAPSADGIHQHDHGDQRRQPAPVPAGRRRRRCRRPMPCSSLTEAGVIKTSSARVLAT